MKGMKPSERKLFGVFVRDALSRPDEDSIDTSKRNPKTVHALRFLGLIHPIDDNLTIEGFRIYFEQSDEIVCPQEVQRLVDRFGIQDIHWRRPSGVISTQMLQERGKAFVLQATMFIGPKADLGTWAHELAHLLFPRIDKADIASLTQTAKKFYSVEVDGGYTGGV